MITFALISLFLVTTLAAILSLSDSALRGARAFKQLSQAVQIERMECDGLVQASIAHRAHKSAFQNTQALTQERCSARIRPTACEQLPAAA